MIDALEMLFAVVLGGWFLAARSGLLEHVRDRADRRDPVDAARRAYVDGEIGEAELEKRLSLALDPEADRIRESIEPIGGIGPATSAAIASEFSSLEQLQGASRDDLEDVHGVGPSTAEAVRERFS